MYVLLALTAIRLMTFRNSTSSLERSIIFSSLCISLENSKLLTLAVSLSAANFF